MSALPVFDLNHPKVRIKFTLFGNDPIYFGLCAVLQHDPFSRTRHQIKATMPCHGVTIQRVEFDQNSTGCVIPMRNHECGNVLQPQTPQVGLNPEFSGQPGHSRHHVLFPQRKK